MQKFPETSLGLLEALEKMVPEQVPSPKSNRDEDLFEGGRRSLVKFIRDWHTKTKNPPAALPQRSRR